MTTNDRLQSKPATAQIVQTLDRHELPDRISELVERYEAVAGDRDRFLWKWLHYLFPEITLSCTEAAHRDRVQQAKLVASMYVVLLDDLAELHRDRRSFEEAAKVPFAHQFAVPDRPGVDAGYVAFADEVWTAFERIVADAPRGDEFDDLLRFDVKQNLNAIEYSYLANRHLELGNLDESTLYDCHNMMLLTYADVDLLHARPFARSDLSTLRRVLLKAQEMARIGNWITTWERELTEGDFSSGVVVRALEEGAIGVEDLARLRDRPSEERAGRLIDRIQDAGVENEFLRRWHANRVEIESLADEVESVDVEAYLDGMRTIMEFHLASRGLK